MSSTGVMAISNVIQQQSERSNYIDENLPIVEDYRYLLLGIKLEEVGKS